MRLRDCVFILVAGLPCHASGHRDPQGDIHPEVSVKDGLFEITFQRKPTSESEELGPRVFSITYSKDGKVLVPRHAVSPEMEGFPYSGPAAKKHPPVVEFKLPGQKEDEPPFFLLAEGPKKRVHHAFWIEHSYKYPRRKETALPLQVSAFSPDVIDAAAQDKHIAVAWSDSQAHHEDTASLKLSVLSGRGDLKGRTIEIGKACAFYSTPMATPLLWASGRWWIGWQKAASSAEDDFRVQMMLTSYDPKNGRIEHKALQGSSYWITSLSLATTGDWLCLAWHGPSPGPLSFSQIVTAFEKLPGSAH